MEWDDLKNHSVSHTLLLYLTVNISPLKS